MDDKIRDGINVFVFSFYLGVRIKERRAKTLSRNTEELSTIPTNYGLKVLDWHYY